MLHCCATLATASRSMVNLGSSFILIEKNNQLPNGNTENGQLTSTLQNTVKLTVHQYIGVPANRGSEVRVNGQVQREMIVLGNV